MRRNPESRFGSWRLWLVLALGWMTSVQAGVPSELVITQAVAEGTRITAYVAVRDAAGAALTDVDAARLRATVGARMATLEDTTPFDATGEGVLTLLLVDVSRSLDTVRLARIRQALRAWVATLGEHDQAALLTFGTQVHTRVAPTGDRAALDTAIAQLAPTDDRTALHQALATALVLGRQRAEGLPQRRAIVILSDGLDDAPGGMTADEVLARLDEGAIPILAIGFGQTHDRARREAGLSNLGRLARRTGGFLIDASASDDPGAAYGALRERLHAVTRVRLQCAECVADGQRQRLRIGLTTEAGLTLEDGMDVRLYPESAPEPAAVATPPAGPFEGEGVDATPDAATDVEGPESPSASTAPEVSTAPFDGVRVWLVQWWPQTAGAAALLLLMLGLAWRARATARSRTAGGVAAPSAPEPGPERVEIPAPDPRPARTAPPPTGPAIRLTFMKGPRRGQSVRLVLAPAGLFGRAPGGAAGTALAVPEDDELSARHARLSLSGQTLILEDLGSTNGTWLNGVSLSAPHPVRAGDVLMCCGSARPSCVWVAWSVHEPESASR
ncbi:VWA domain-containing protein [Thiocystis violacea]|uniref:VWA domain-containing protein n=1 Tax=Thiocystis violacea TaxID=13725 RepID=UPI0019083512|nr:VWA domain-containing protein [Thiocystis violacea]